MLTQDDAYLAAYEQALPGLAMLMDEEAFAAALRERLPDAGVTSASQFHARYKPGHSCVVAYRVRVGDGDVDVYARAMPRESFERIEDMRQRAPVAGSLGAGGLLLEDAAVYVYVFPNDRRIETLALLGQPDTRSELLSNVLPDRPALWGAHVSRLRYRPEQRFVARLEGVDGERAALKLHARERSYAKAGRNAVAFTSRGPLRVPACVGRSDRLRATALEWLPGENLDGLIGKPGFDTSLLASVGAALAELHLQEPAGLSRQDPAARSNLRNWGGLVTDVRPDLAEQVGALCEQLEDELGKRHTADRSIHGDFGPTQVLVADGSVSIIDLDNAVRGDPAEDLGVFIAKLERRVVNGKLSAARSQKLIAALLAGYEAHAGAGGIDRVRLRRHVAATLVRRLPGAFGRRAPDWRSRIGATLARAEEIAA
jgi:aminoglycoside phosphotransferase (APT) family kinase protein